MPAAPIVKTSGTAGNTASAATASVATTLGALQTLAVAVTPGTGKSNQITIAGWVKEHERNYNAGDAERTVSLWSRAGTGASISATIDTPGAITYFEITWAWLEWPDVVALLQPTSAIGNSGAPAVNLGAFADVANGTLAVVGSAGGLDPGAGAGFTQVAEVSGTVFGDFLNVSWQNANDTSVTATGTGSDFWGIIGVELSVAVPDPPQIAAPVADVSNAGWTPSTGVTLFGVLDETTPDDGDYISTQTPGASCEVQFAGVNDPQVDTGHIASYRISGDGTSAIQVDLREGPITRKTWVHSPAPTSATTFAQTLTDPEAAAIGTSGYTAGLSLLFTEFVPSGGRPTSRPNPDTLAGPLTPSGQIVAAQDQLIQGLQITTTTGPGVIVPPGVTGVRIWGCEIGPCGTSDPNDINGLGVFVDAGASVDVAGCVIHDVASGLYSLSGVNPILFEYNYVYNVRGPKPRGQMVQFNIVQGGTVGSRIRFNVSDAKVGFRHGVDHGQGVALPDHGIEDHISMHDHTGVASQWTEISFNHLRGGHNLSTTGSGMILGDGQNPGGNQWSHHNTVVEVKNAGIGMAGGFGLLVEDNRIFLSGTADFSGATSDNHIGMYSINFALPTTPTCGNHVANRNRIWAFNNNLASHNEWFDSTDCSPVTFAPDNVVADATLSEAIFDDGN